VQSPPLELMVAEPCSSSAVCFVKSVACSIESAGGDEAPSWPLIWRQSARKANRFNHVHIDSPSIGPEQIGCHLPAMRTTYPERAMQCR
jgi:hypothetical protein